MSLLEHVKNNVVKTVRSITKSRNETKIRQLIFQYWVEAEKKYGCFFCLSVKDYEDMIRRIFA